MTSDKLKLFALALKFLVPYSIQAIKDCFHGLIHRYTYKAVDSPKNVVIIGGSFAGVELARRFSHSLPSGYRVLVVERNSHFNYTFNFPRYSVLQGHEQLAFIPYGGLARSAPDGIFQHVHGEVTSISEDSVTLASGEEVPFAYLILATGSAQNPPAKLSATDKSEACLELQGFQKAIEAATKIAILGGGAVGVELATDIKSYYPEKAVTLIHSREQLLPRFGSKLHKFVLTALKKLGVEVVLGERPQLLPSEKATDDEKASNAMTSIHFAGGHVADFDLVVPCTGQTANSSLIAQSRPNAISQSTGRILVKTTLQLSGNAADNNNVFAIGDIAETGAPKMARAALLQATTVEQNVLSIIRGQGAVAQYQPKLAMEGALKLTLGKASRSDGPH